jgi:phage terminase small subunit
MSRRKKKKKLLEPNISEQPVIAKRPPKTLKEKRFVEALATAPTATDALIQAGYNVKNRDSARSLAAQTLAKLSMSDIFDELGMTDKKLAENFIEASQATKVISANVVIVKPDDPTAETAKADARTVDFIDVPDWPSRLKANENIAKLKDKYPDDKLKVNGSIDHRHEVMAKMGLLEEEMDGDSRES